MQRRMSSAQWQALADEDLRAPWALCTAALGRLYSDAGDRRATLALTYLWNFTEAFNIISVTREGSLVEPVDVHDLRRLNGAQEGVMVAHLAWEQLVVSCGLHGRYLKRVQTLLSQALSVSVESLAVVVNPALRRHRMALERVTGLRSARGSFTLFECLPLDIRRMDPRSLYHILLLDLASRLLPHLRSSSRGNLQKSLLFFDKILRACPAVTEDGDCSDVVRTLAKFSAADWLDLYGRVFEAETKKISGVYFEKQIRLLHLLHGKILSPSARSKIPLCRGAILERAQSSRKTGNQSSSESSSGSFGSTGCSDLDDSLNREQQRLRAKVAELRAMRCAESASAEDDDDTVYAFSPAEIRAIIMASTSTFERLVVSLFLTTGLRIAGVCRLLFPRLPANVDPRSVLHRRPHFLNRCGRLPSGKDIPTELSTTEKNAATRRVFLSPANRILIARWLREECPVVDGSYHWLLQTSKSIAKGQPMSTSWLWKACRQVFVKARLTGPHVHPHTFRHTLVHLMYISGNTFEKIAKFLGHSSPNITSRVYGRLRHMDAIAGVQGVPFLQDAKADANAQEWRAIGQLLRDPWRASAVEYEGLLVGQAQQAARTVVETAGERKRRLLEETRAAKRHTEAAGP